MNDDEDGDELYGHGNDDDDDDDEMALPKQRQRQRNDDDDDDGGDEELMADGMERQSDDRWPQATASANSNVLLKNVLYGTNYKTTIGDNTRSSECSSDANFKILYSVYVQYLF